ncbi:MAG: gas vesicle protein [Ectothiorhodospiraceae bacterium]|nr:gas vesicle protein [Ectothiorhodospiraceae bacterium]
MANDKLAQGMFLGFLAGAVTGGILGLLYAPKPGKELRGDLKEKSGEIAHDVDQYLKEAQTKAKELINEGKTKSSELIKDAKVKADELIKDAEKVIDSAKGRITNEGDRLKTAVDAGVSAFKETGEEEGSSKKNS